MQSDLFEGFVLAGGASSRMGADKANLRFGGETFLSLAARTLAETCGKVKIVLNENQLAPDGCETVRDEFKSRGALGGIHAALVNCAGKWAIILAVDLPLVGVEAIENLQRVALDSDGFSAIVPRQQDGRLQPLCAAYLAADCLPQIGEFLRRESSNSVRDFLRLVPTKIVEANLLSADENLFFNVNRPRDFQALK